MQPWLPKSIQTGATASVGRSRRASKCLFIICCAQHQKLEVFRMWSGTRMSRRRLMHRYMGYWSSWSLSKYEYCILLISDSTILVKIDLRRFRPCSLDFLNQFRPSWQKRLVYAVVQQINLKEFCRAAKNRSSAMENLIGAKTMKSPTQKSWWK